MKKLTVAELLALKGRRQLTEVFTMNAEEAAACEAAGIDLLVTPLSTAQAIRAAAPNTFLTVGLVGDYGASDEHAVRSGYQALAAGGDAVYINASPLRVQAMAREWIPVVGHVGFVPYRSTWFGGNRAVGKTAEEARKVYEDTLRYQDAGAIGVEMELVPHQVAAEISRRVKILIISMGAGTGGDAQYLFAEDILGTNAGHVPRHAKTYRNLRRELDRLQQERVAAFAEFKAEVDCGAYPEPRHLVEANPGELAKFLQAISAKR